MAADWILFPILLILRLIKLENLVSMLNLQMMQPSCIDHRPKMKHSLIFVPENSINELSINFDILSLKKSCILIIQKYIYKSYLLEYVFLESDG